MLTNSSRTETEAAKKSSIAEFENPVLPDETNEAPKVYVASQWQLMWWRFRRHRLAVVSTLVVLLLYLIALFCEFIAPYDPAAYSVDYTYAPPQQIHFWDNGEFQGRPFVYGYLAERDPETLEMVYKPDPATKYSLYFFVHGTPYKMWGLFDSDLHLFGIKEPDGALFLFGSDRNGRDLFTRVIYGARISLSIGLIGVFLALFLGILIGGASGYYGGFLDNILQRTIEFLRSIPSIPLWLALSAALPADWSALRVYFGITIILSLIGWTDLARVVRGRFLSLREEDFVLAAALYGVSEIRIILRHMVPSFLSHIIASLTLAIPTMILSETALSFLGVGLRPPIVSWGVLLKEAQNVQSLQFAPWLFIPGAFVVVTVLAFNFMGDGLRDAADPYAQ
ncbi:MAG: ABC transporter permease [Caldilineaceae bacterium]|nr:ABC transporter permease [Caldilineaceae bacterium]